MRVHRSNRTELLADALADLLATGTDPMVTEVVAVQGRGMERWLTMHLAKKLGIATNLRFPFPRTVIEEVLAQLLGEDARVGRYEPERITFDLLEILPHHLGDERFVPLARYLEESPIGEGRPIEARVLSLVHRLAKTFDRYFTYRPDLVLRWLEGKETPAEAGYQPVLLRALVEKAASKTLPQLVEQAVKRLGSEPFEAPWPRLFLFGISTLPPQYLRLLEALSQQIPVHLFWLAPSEHYIGDQLTPQQEARERLRHGGGDLAPLHLGGHPLLRSFGKLSSEFHQLLEEVPYEDDARFEPAEAKGLLHVLQNDLCELRDPQEREKLTLDPIDFAKLPEPFASDRTIEIHACHGPTRQVEVLRDVLVRLFDEMPDLQPRDVVVMAPNIDDLAPVIDAVFSVGDDVSTPERERVGFPRLPYRIADRQGVHDNPVADSTLALLELARGRLRAPEVLSFLGREPVAQRFGFDTSKLGIVRRWFEATGTRIGEDGEHRRSFGLPDDDEQTFRDGLSRMLLGHLMRGEGRRLFHGKLAYDEAGHESLLESLVDALDTLFDFLRRLRQPNTVEGFCKLIREAIEALFRSSEHEQLQAVRKALTELENLAKGEASEGENGQLRFTLDAFARLLEIPLRAPRSGSFLSGAVTFCAMVPMRAVPFRVVCLLGIDDGAFPRRSSPDGFDLDPKHRPGDRKLEDDDRHLFLEALLSARDRFLVFHSGRSSSDNKRLPRAVPLEELLDAMAETVPIAGDSRLVRKAIVKRYVVEHPLNAYSPASFKEPEHPIDTRSYDRQRLATAKKLLAQSKESAPFLQGLPLNPLDEVQLTPQELARFLANPVAGFLEKRLGIRAEEGEEEIDDRERLELDHLESYAVHDAAIELLRDGVPEDEVPALLRARSLLPVGLAGKVSARTTVSAAKTFRQGFADIEGPKRPPLSVDLRAHGLPIVGRLHDMTERGRLVVTWSRSKAQRFIENWILHLVYCACTDDPEPWSYLVERDSETREAQVTVFRPEPDPIAKLEALFRLWEKGQTVPLLFFPEAAAAYAKALKDSKKATREEKEAEAAIAAYKAFEKKDKERASALFCRLFEGYGPELLTRDVDWPDENNRFPDLFDAIWKPAAEGSETK